MGCGECQGNAIVGLAAASPLDRATPVSAVVATTASLVAVRRWSATLFITVADHRASDPRIR
jgi:hypothetical protein